MNKRIRVSDIKLPIASSDIEALKAKISKQLRVGAAAFLAFEITKKAIDARKKSDIVYVFSVELTLELPKEKWQKILELANVKECEKATQANTFKVYRKGSEFFLSEGEKTEELDDYDLAKRIVVVGCGPAGLFAALTLAEAGLCPLVIERGKTVDERLADINGFLANGALNPESNVLFGEGGAGAFSDGKLTTGTKDSRVRRILEEFVNAGADDEILYNSKPHIGTDRLQHVLRALRFKIISMGGSFLFSTKLVDLELINGKLCGITVESKGLQTEMPCDRLILAMGNSATDSLRMVHAKGLAMAKKPFSIGVRIEHTREFIDKSQYGISANELPAAEYKLSMYTKSGIGVYTFCMCPGGFVIPSVNTPGLLCINGMSNHARDGYNSNAALLVTITPDDSDNVFSGIDYRENLEKKAFLLGGGNYHAPITRVGDFMRGQASSSLGHVEPSFRPGFKLCDISECLGGFVSDALREALVEFDTKIKGFADESAILTAVESRSSSPVKILRRDDYSTCLEGVYPAGEGGGFAGGIMSSAVDGIKAAEALCRSLRNKMNNV